MRPAWPEYYAGPGILTGEGDNRKEVPGCRSIFSGLYLVEKDPFGKFPNFLFFEKRWQHRKAVIRYKTEFTHLCLSWLNVEMPSAAGKIGGLRRRTSAGAGDLANVLFKQHRAAHSCRKIRGHPGSPFRMAVRSVTGFSGGT